MTIRATFRHVLTPPPPPPSSGGVVLPPSRVDHYHHHRGHGHHGGSHGHGHSGILQSPTASTLGPAPSGTSLHDHSTSSSTGGGRPTSTHGGNAGGGGAVVGSAASLGAASAAAASLSSEDTTASGSDSVSRPRLLCVHPTLPLCAYVLTNPTATQSQGSGGDYDTGYGGRGGKSIAGLMRGAPTSAVASTIDKPGLSSGNDDSTTTTTTTSTAIWDGRDQKIVIQDYARDSIIKVFHVCDVASWINAEECRRDIIADMLEAEAADGNKNKEEEKPNAKEDGGIGRTVMLGTVRSISFWDRHVGKYTCADGTCETGLAATAGGAAPLTSGDVARRRHWKLPRGGTGNNGSSSELSGGGGGGAAADNNKNKSASLSSISNQYQVGTKINSTLDPCGMPPSIVVQFDTRTVLLNLRGPGRNPTPGGLVGGRYSCGPLPQSTSMLDPYRPLTALINPEDLAGNVPTSPAVPVTSSVLAIGCSDGTMRFYDMDTTSGVGSKNKKKGAAASATSAPSLGLGSVIKSVRGPNGRNDPVVRVVNVNAESSSAPAATNGGGNGGVDKSARVLTVCASGVAFLWDIFISLAPDGTVVKFKINPPVCRLDGLGENRRAEINPTADFYGGRAQCSLITATRVTYDAQNDVVSWCVPNYAGVGRHHTVTWELKWIPPSGATFVAPRLPPRAVAVLPTNLMMPGEVEEGGADGAGGGATDSSKDGEGGDSAGVGPAATHSAGSSSAIVDVVPGYAHPSLPCDGTAVTCLVVTSKGDIATVSSSSLAGRKDSATSVAIPFHHTTLASLISLPLGSSSAAVSPKSAAGAALLDARRGNIRIYTIAVPTLLPNVCLLATSGGVIIIDLADSSAQTAGTRHALLAPDAVSFAGQQRGQATGRQRNPAALLVTQGVLYAGMLDCPPIDSKSVASGPVRTVNLTPVHTTASSSRSQMTTAQGPVGSSNRPHNALKPSPRLLPSPSGNFVCLYWHRENRYEILHVATLIKTSRASTDIRQLSSERQTSALVDSGTAIRSFAWVGDGDVFALLHPSASGDDEISLSSPQGTAGKKGNRRAKAAKFKTKLSGGAGDEETDDFDTSAGRTGPRVELKVLVMVTAEATEISGSVAAATATTLGDMVLRGGARNPPTTLFGGPVLCVASLTYDREGRPDGMAYLYARKEGSDAADNRASAYGTVGPSLPYPDLVVWDDEGRHCAVVVGERVAVYGVSNSCFSLVGTAPILSGVRAECGATVVESAKFIHGVLYVSTQSSVQVTFLSEGAIDGDGEESGSRGTLDSYILAGLDVSATSSSNNLIKSLRPSALSMPLNSPSILAYHGSSLLLSTASGVRAVPLSHPLLRIGVLLAAGQPEAASRWFDVVPKRHHETLASFLERRGAPDLAVTLPGLSLESTIDICIRHGITDHLKELVDKHSVLELRAIDGGGRSSGASRSIVVGIALHLFAEEQFDTVSRIASDLLDLGDGAKEEGLLLAGLLVSAGTEGADKLLNHAIGTLPNDSVPVSAGISTAAVGT